MTTLKRQSSHRPVAAEVPSFRVEDDFYLGADALRHQLEDSFLAHDEAGVTPLAYVFSENRYQLLTASVESVLAAESLRELIDYLGDWGQREVGTSHVSTPQVRVYIDGCERSVIQDAVMLGWHYMLSLSRVGRSSKGERVRIVVPDRLQRKGGIFGKCNLVDSELRFNRLIVHDTQNAYGIGPVRSSMNPLEGTIFLDGYLW